MTENLIDRYYNIVSEYCDAPEVFIRASGYHLVSSLLGRFLSSKNFPGRPVIGIVPNVWFILSSIPGRTRRSTVHNCDSYVYKKTLKDFLEDDENKDRIIEDSVIEEGTPEGIADHIVESNRDLNLKHYDIQSPEFGGVFKKTQKGNYEEGLPTAFSKLYSGEGGTAYLSKRGSGSGLRRIPYGLYVTMFAGMQKPEHYLKEFMIGQGLLRRIMICYVPTRNITMKGWKPPGRMDKVSPYEELEDISNSLVEKMNDYKKIIEDSDSSRNTIEANFHPRLIEEINKVARKCDEKLSGRDETLLDIYQQSLWEHYAKISILESASRGNIEDNELFVSMKDGDRAREFLRVIQQQNEEIVDSVHKSYDIVSYKKPSDRWYSYILSAGPNGRTNKDLAGKFNPKPGDKNEILSLLIQQEKIYFTKKRRGERGPEPTVYIATEFQQDEL